MDAESGIRRWSQDLGDERSRDQAAGLDELVEEETCKLRPERTQKGARATDKKRSMPSENDVPPVSSETEQINKMEKRKERLDSLFEYALVLLGVLAAAEFQYFLTTEEEGIFPYALRVFTVPFTIMILFWLVKELFSDTLRSDAKMLLTEYCWDFWSFTLFYYLFVISGGLQYGGLQIGVIVPFLLSILLIYLDPASKGGILSLT